MAKLSKDLGIDFHVREPVNAQRAANKVGGAGKTLSALPPTPPSNNQLAIANILNTPTPPAARLAPLKKAAVVEGKVAMVPSKAAKLPFIGKEKTNAVISGLYKKFSIPQDIFTKAQYAAYENGDLDDSDLRKAVIAKTKKLIDRDINKKFTTNIVFTKELYDKVYNDYEQ